MEPVIFTHNNKFISSALLLFLILPGCTSEYKYNSKEFTILEDVTIIDGKGNPPLSQMYIVLRDSSITHIGSMNQKLYGGSANIINLNGKYVIPGLIDVHVHVTVLKTVGGGKNSDEIDTAVSLNSLKTFLDYGVTTVRNPAGPENAAVWLRNMIKSGQSPGPDIITSGRALNRSGGGPFVRVLSDEDIESAIDQQHNAGVDIIKIYSTLTPAQSKKAISYAHTKGLKVIGHLQNTTWTEAAGFGIDFITHAAPWSAIYIPAEYRAAYSPTIKGRVYWLRHIDLNKGPVPEMMKLLKENNIIVDPTLLALHTKFWGNDSMYIHSPDNTIADSVILKNWKSGSFVDDWDAKDFAAAEAQWPKLQKYIKLMYDTGVTLAAGSDFPNPWVLPGVALHREMELLQQCGIAPLEVIKTATYNGALALGLHDILGSVEINKTANLIVLNKNPLADITNTKSIFIVFKNGKEIPY